MKATLTWLRHSQLRALQNIDLFLYKRVNSAWTRVTSSEPTLSGRSTIDNVEQVAEKTTAQTEYLVKVKSVQQFDPTVPNEPFGLATSHAFQHRTGPEVSVNCVAPPPAQPLQSVTVQCTALNQGQLSLYGATAMASPGTVGNGDLGTMDPGTPVTFTVTATAPAQSGASTGVAVNVSGTLADETYNGAGGFTISTQSSIDNCTFSVTPSVTPSMMSVPNSMQGISGTFQLTTESNCPWIVRPSALTTGWGGVITWDWVTVTPISGIGSAVFSYTVPANNWVGYLAPAYGAVGIGQFGSQHNAFFGITLCGNGPCM
jgi:hypothetical protein